MYAKSNNPHGRRTPLSLSAAAGGKQQQMQSQQHQQQQHHQNKGTNGNSGNGKHEKKHDEPTLAELKETLQKETKKQQIQQQQNAEKKQQQQNAEKKQQQQNAVEKKNAEKLDEKKTQNGQNSAKNNGNAKEKQKEIVETVDLTSSNEIVTPEKAEKNEKPEKSTKEEREKTKTVGRKGEQQQQQQQQPPPPQQQQQSNNEQKEKDNIEKKLEKVADKKKQADAGPIEKSNASNGEQQKIIAPTPITPTKAVVAPEKTATPTNASVATTPTSAKKPATPNKPEKVTPTAKKSMATIVIDDVEMREEEKPEATPTTAAKMDISPKKVPESTPAATSTPGKVLSAIKRIATTTTTTTKTESGGSSPDRVDCQRSYSQISGRRSIRPLTEYTPSYFQSNAQYRESYRRINTELDVTSMTNTSLNVTVGSEVPNNSSFSFFGRGRKRDRTSPVKSQSAMELQTDVELSPPKRARLDMQGFFSAVASPLTLLRSRFSKATIQSSSTPMKLRSKLAGDAGVDGDNEAEEAEECEVQNVSGISVQEEELHNGESGEEVTAVEEEAKGDGAAVDDAQNTLNAKDAELNAEKLEGEQLEKGVQEQGISAGGSTPELMHDAQGKHKRCSIM